MAEVTVVIGEAMMATDAGAVVGGSTLTIGTKVRFVAPTLSPTYHAIAGV